ncbi:MAG: glycosyltransferase family 4 protein [Solirubrobacterales bacterium]|nr:glycosyltransferase family 4 protein [Solirubrobacterales bacterium]
MFLALCDEFPDADIFTAVYDEDGTEGRFADRRVHTSFLQRVKPKAGTFRAMLPLYPYAIEALDLRGYDLVLSSSSAWAHGVIPDERATHVCYCYNPFRYAWNEREATLAKRNPATRAALSVIFQRWRQWDWIAAQRVDSYVAVSETTQRRIARYFNRESEVIYPPVETGRFTLGEVGDSYVMLSELMAHKRIDIAIHAFNRLRLPLVVMGNGPDARRLHRIAGPTIRFEGRVSDERAAVLLSQAKAMVVTATEEFGIAAVEAQAAGRPVIALAEGGVRETVIEGETGIFYDHNSVEALMDAVATFDPMEIDPAACVRNAERFDVVRFRNAMRRVVEEQLAADRRDGPVRRRPGRARGLALAS